jgi:hypothetical protein
VLGITSDISKWVDGYSTDLPWDSNGHDVTGLTKRSIKQAHWTDHIPPDLVRDVVGYTPKQQQAEITRCVNKRLTDEAHN